MLMFQVRQCTDQACQFRYPVGPGDFPKEFCPRCGEATQLVSERQFDPQAHNMTPELAPGPPIEVLLDNVRSVFNVGAIFRTADGVGVRHLHLCGITPTPEHKKFAKTALGAENTLPWTYDTNAIQTAQNLAQRGVRLWVLEDSPHATSLFTLNNGKPNQSKMGAPIGLVVGNEISGVDPELLQMCERIVSIPMQGIKRSLNVAVAFGIAIYHLRWSK